eukprot:CAMPEP_0198147612 /NCGR_PEP_ID=MMETSP1443-20131203/36900_1 /TAXON_ID=186043 /ORGANISM="Entomoneis sp., Strain CCMP2396" /LENGTH=341 /DNA_ID=CAMNT_0043812021 /DNA_START=204 /DNA_END=1229 /DNA_ORIENTATION=+
MSSSSTSMSKTVAVAQLCSTSNKIDNLFQMAKCAGWAMASQSKMLFLPEACGFLGQSAKETFANAEPPFLEDKNEAAKPVENPMWLTEQLQKTVSLCSQGKANEDPDLNDVIKKEQCENISVLQGLQTIARASQMYVSIGGLHVLVDDSNDDKRVYNTHLVLDENGEIKAIYRKIHLFDVSIPGQVQLRESDSTAAGHEIILCDTPIGRMGLTTCYDVRFSEIYVKLVEQGAEILLVPSAFTVPTGKAHWHVLLRARAIESQCYVIAAAQFGSHNAKRSSYGHSLVVDPWGQVLADAGGVDSPQDGNLPTPSIITAEIDLDNMASIRQRLPIQQHRQAAEY